MRTSLWIILTVLFISSQVPRFPLKRKLAMAGALLLGLLLTVSAPAKGDTVTWATWTAASGGTPGSASGTIGTVGVTYSGQLEYFYPNTFPSWMPTSTWAGGTVANGPPSPGNIIGLFGGPGTGTATITFSVPVVDPVMAIWSLGDSITAEFVFTGSEPFTVEAGGPSAEFAGGPIYTAGCPANTVCGAEGNGTIRFHGTFSSLTWTNPIEENWYGFELGIPNSTVPEPGSLLLLGTGLVGLAGTIRRKLKR
jgi:hypothetical protein